MRERGKPDSVDARPDGARLYIFTTNIHLPYQGISNTARDADGKYHDVLNSRRSGHLDLPDSYICKINYLTDINGYVTGYSFSGNGCVAKTPGN